MSEDQPAPRPGTGAIVFLALALLCVACERGCDDVSAAKRTWEKTSGKIVIANIAGKTGGRRGMTPGFEPRLEYSYTVEGKTYTGTRLEFCTPWTKYQEEIAQRLAPYPQGSKADVWYNPAAPAESVLEMKNSEAIYRLIGWYFLVVSCLGMVVMCVRTFLEKRRNPVPVS